MAVTARFFVAEVTEFAHGSGWAPPAPMGRIVLRPALKSDANKEWASATPSGEIHMTVAGGAFPWFHDRLGDDVHITFDDIPSQD